VSGYRGLLLWVLTFLFVRCTEELEDVRSAETPLKIHSAYHNYHGRLLFLSKSQDGFIYGLADYNGKFDAVHTNEEGVLANPRNFSETEVLALDSVVIDYSISTVSNLFQMLQANDGSFQYSEGRIGSDPEIALEIEIRFGGSSKQKAHRFVSPEGSGHDLPRQDYEYQDYVDVPFEVWNVASDEQLTVSFRDQANNGQYDLLPFRATEPPDETNSLEFIFVHDVPYSPDSPDPELSSVGLHARPAMHFSLLLNPIHSGWSANTGPSAQVRILKNDAYLRCPTRVILDAVYTDQTAEYWLLVTGRDTKEMVTLITLNDQMMVKKVNPLFNGDYVFQEGSLYPTFDGGVVAVANEFNQQGIPSSSVAKVDATNSVEYKISKTRAFSHGFELNNKFHLTWVNSVFEFGPAGVSEAYSTEISFSSVSNVEVWNEYLVVLYDGDVEPELVLFDKNLVPAGYKQVRGVFPGSSVDLIAAGNTLYLTGSSSFSEQGILLGKTGYLNAQVTVKSHDTGFGVLQMKSCVLDGGGAAHVLQKTTSYVSSDIFFLKTDADLEIVKD
jgi:hypothetical protein